MIPETEKQFPTDLQMFTPNEAAEKLKVSAEQVRTLIRNGQLAAINVGSGQKRPLYRVTELALQDFMDRRWQPGPAVKKKRFKPPPPIQDHFPGLK